MIHSLMLTSNPNYILIKPNTLKVISKITEFRTETKLPICFTLDAGSNVHLLYPENIKKKISDFIKVEISKGLKLQPAILYEDLTFMFLESVCII